MRVRKNLATDRERLLFLLSKDLSFDEASYALNLGATHLTKVLGIGGGSTRPARHTTSAPKKGETMWARMKARKSEIRRLFLKEGYTSEQIAEKLGFTTGGVRTFLSKHRILKGKGGGKQTRKKITTKEKWEPIDKQNIKKLLTRRNK